MRIIVANAERMMSLLRPRHRSKDNIMLDLTGMEPSG